MGPDRMAEVQLISLYLRKRNERAPVGKTRVHVLYSIAPSMPAAAPSPSSAKGAARAILRPLPASSDQPESLRNSQSSNRGLAPARFGPLARPRCRGRSCESNESAFDLSRVQVRIHLANGLAPTANPRPRRRATEMQCHNEPRPKNTSPKTLSPSRFGPLLDSRPTAVRCASHSSSVPNLFATTLRKTVSPSELRNRSPDKDCPLLDSDSADKKTVPISSATALRKAVSLSELRNFSWDKDCPLFVPLGFGALRALLTGSLRRTSQSSVPCCLGRRPSPSRRRYGSRPMN